MQSKIVPFISGAMLVIGVGLLVINQNKLEKLMKDFTNKATNLADKFKGKNHVCECNCESNQEKS